MATPIYLYRTNYFRVEDPAQFRRLLDLVGVPNCAGYDSPAEFMLHTYNEENGWPSWVDEPAGGWPDWFREAADRCEGSEFAGGDEEETFNTNNFVELLAQFLAPGEVLIETGGGFERARYCSGHAQAWTRLKDGTAECIGDVSTFDIYRLVSEAGFEVGNFPGQVTRAEY